jgi:xanthine dehydrogenase accessory factor
MREVLPELTALAACRVDDRCLDRGRDLASCPAPRRRVQTGRPGQPGRLFGARWLCPGCALVSHGLDRQGRGEDMGVFCAGYVPKPRILVFGAIDSAAAKAPLGSFPGHHVRVRDDRPVLRRSPGSRRLTSWRGRRYGANMSAPPWTRTVICVLTDDPKFDVPLPEVGRRLPDLAYIGAMGSRRTHGELIGALGAAGLRDQQLAHLSSPIGLDLGARTPEETAVSIAAEIIALRWGGGGGRLSLIDGRIHHEKHQN